jgi:hypothetical protein
MYVINKDLKYVVRKYSFGSTTPSAGTGNIIVGWPYSDQQRQHGHAAVCESYTGNKSTVLLISGISLHGVLNLPYEPAVQPQPSYNT